MAEKSRYNDEELDFFDEVILKKIAKATEELDYYMVQMKEQEDAEAKLKGLDDASSAQENEKNQAMAGRQRKLIQHLENARFRIKKKTYGICRETGVLISKERLSAVPHATLSILAKQSHL